LFRFSYVFFSMHHAREVLKHDVETADILLQHPVEFSLVELACRRCQYPHIPFLLVRLFRPFSSHTQGYKSSKLLVQTWPTRFYAFTSRRRHARFLSFYGPFPAFARA
jgi:hypothetical protein